MGELSGNIDTNALWTLGWTPSDVAAIRRRRAAARAEVDTREGNERALEVPEAPVAGVTEADVAELVDEDVTACAAAGQAFEARPQKSTLADLTSEIMRVVGFDSEVDGNTVALTHEGRVYKLTVSIPRST